jgi:hypothetical protein
MKVEPEPKLRRYLQSGLHVIYYDWHEGKYRVMNKSLTIR